MTVINATTKMKPMIITMDIDESPLIMSAIKFIIFLLKKSIINLIIIILFNNIFVNILFIIFLNFLHFKSQYQFKCSHLQSYWQFYLLLRLLLIQ